ncbi:signal recognition particle, SRP19 subunit [Daldinia sp. FL1419]|nr:signal recognition particle, SRP19 subunit [Daldinia sp. FL1419]
MSHPRVEEVSDSDLSDPSEGDIEDFVESDILRQKAPATTTTPAPAPSSSSRAPPSFPSASGPSLQQPPPQVQASDIKDHQMLYPVYFDATRSRAQGRRVPKTLAVKNPLAREIAAACAALRLSPVFEAHRIHPKDWANPGRVRVKLSKGSSSGAASPYAATVKNKHHLYILVAQHLQAHPTTDSSDALRRVRVPGLGLGAPNDDEPWPRPAIPRGWKMGELLPAYSAAMTGGGVSENAFKDMMREMQGGGGGGPADMMSMLGQGLGGFGGLGGAGPSAGESGGGGKKAKKGKGKA